MGNEVACCESRYRKLDEDGDGDAPVQVLKLKEPHENGNAVRTRLELRAPDASQEAAADDQMQERGDIEVTTANTDRSLPSEVLEALGDYVQDGEQNGRPIYRKLGGNIRICYSDVWWIGTLSEGLSSLAIADSRDKQVPKSGWQSPKSLLYAPRDLPLVVRSLKSNDIAKPSTHSSCLEGCSKHWPFIRAKLEDCCEIARENWPLVQEKLGECYEASAIAFREKFPAVKLNAMRCMASVVSLCDAVVRGKKKDTSDELLPDTTVTLEKPTLSDGQALIEVEQVKDSFRSARESSKEQAESNVHAGVSETSIPARERSLHLSEIDRLKKECMTKEMEKESQLDIIVALRKEKSSLVQELQASKDEAHRLMEAAAKELRLAAEREREIFAEEAAKVELEQERSEAVALPKDAGAIDKLVQQLKASTPGEREKAAAELRDLAWNNSENKAAIVDAGAVDPLVTLLSGNTLGERELAAGALQILAFNRDNQVTIAESGAIGPLVQLLRASSVGEREMAAGALRNLANNKNNAVAAAEAGAIGPLVALLKAGTPGEREQAAGALGGLSGGSSQNQVAIAQAGAIDLLVHQLQAGAACEREQARLALRSLARDNSDNKGAIIDAGGNLEFF